MILSNSSTTLFLLTVTLGLAACTVKVSEGSDSEGSNSESSASESSASEGSDSEGSDSEGATESSTSEPSSTDTEATDTEMDAGTDADTDTDDEEVLACVDADPAVGELQVALILDPPRPYTNHDLDLPCTFSGLVVDGPVQTMNLECIDIDDTMLDVGVEIRDSALSLPTPELGAALQIRAVEREAENYYISVALRRSDSARLLLGASEGPAVIPFVSQEKYFDFWAPFTVETRKSDCEDASGTCTNWRRPAALHFHHTPSDAALEVFRRNLAELDGHGIQVGSADYEWGDDYTCDGKTGSDYHFLIVDASQ